MNIKDKIKTEIGNITGLLMLPVSWASKSLQMVTAVMKLKDGCSLEEKLWQT